MYYFLMEGTHTIKLFKRKALIPVDFVANVNIAEISKRWLHFFITNRLVLEDSLKESIIIRSFCTFANSIVLVVDESNQEVIYLDIYG